MAKRNKNNKQEVIKSLINSIEEGVQNMFSSENFKKYLDYISKFHSYSTGNIFLINLQYPDATRVASLKKWNELGRKVKKGEKGIKILVPVYYRYFRDDNNKIVYLNQATDEQKKKIKDGEIKLYSGLGFKVGHVFDISQTEGEELPTICKELTGEDEKAKAIYETLMQICPIPVIKEDMGRPKGYYSPEKNIIALNENNSLNQNAKTLVHEYAHYTRHHNSDKDRNTIEVEAEAIAYIVCKYFGFDTSDYSFAYISSWSSSKELKELKKSAEIIKESASDIINAVEAVLENKPSKAA